MATKRIHININLDNLLNELLQLLEKTTYFVSIGLQQKDKTDPKLVQLPSSNFPVTYTSKLNWSSEQAQEQYYNWILTNGVKDIIDGINTFLESNHQILSYWEIAKRQRDGEKLTGAVWNKHIINGGKNFHRLGLPNKIDHLKDNHKLELEQNFIDQLLSINTARNCMVHRRGIVTIEDITIDNTLLVKWTKKLIVLKNEDGEQELILGKQIEKKSSLSIKNKPDQKVFKIGEQIFFTIEEFADITWSQFQFGYDVIQKVKEKGVTTGFINPN